MVIDINHLKNSGRQNHFIRSEIFQKKATLRNLFGSDSDMIVLIKPTLNATYENIVNALDEMLICSVKTYVLMDASTAELNWIEYIKSLLISITICFFILLILRLKLRIFLLDVLKFSVIIFLMLCTANSFSAFLYSTSITEKPKHASMEFLSGSGSRWKSL